MITRITLLGEFCENSEEVTAKGGLFAANGPVGGYTHGNLSYYEKAMLLSRDPLQGIAEKGHGQLHGMSPRQEHAS